ncbi:MULTISPECIES: hypothetical protein [Paenibacillus]|uniref:SH3 domain-containing protein n=1 Tax=Paenibacillus apis TaxID=1792174 RepID=A0A919Y1Q4_9BACL|nr:MULTISPECIES: hypothetical protein [Paenibacillus]GIO43251.1 hypothetical protein J41TS4_30090 [Paenibacillus apis]
MKKFTAISASLILAAALGTSASAATLEEPVVPVLEEPIIEAGDVFFAPNPITLLEITYFYNAPSGSAISALAPQDVHPTGEVLGDWVEIYTWLGKAWINVPGYIPSYF